MSCVLGISKNKQVQNFKYLDDGKCFLKKSEGIVQDSEKLNKVLRGGKISSETKESVVVTILSQMKKRL